MCPRPGGGGNDSDETVRNRAGLEPCFLSRILDHAGLCWVGALRRCLWRDGVGGVAVGGWREGHRRAWLVGRLRPWGSLRQGCGPLEPPPLPPSGVVYLGCLSSLMA